MSGKKIILINYRSEMEAHTGGLTMGCDNEPKNSKGDYYRHITGPFISEPMPSMTVEDTYLVYKIIKDKRYSAHNVYYSDCKKYLKPDSNIEGIENVGAYDICKDLNYILSDKYGLIFEENPLDIDLTPIDMYSYIDAIISEKVPNSFTNTTKKITNFIQERDWEKFHNPKDTALALSIEASELNEAFLWKKSDEANIEKVKEELADVLIYSLDLARQYDLDPATIIDAKLKRNAEKYPVDKCKGSNKKYTEL